MTELTLRREHRFDRSRTKRTNQLVFKIFDARVKAEILESSVVSHRQAAMLKRTTHEPFLCDVEQATNFRSRGQRRVGKQFRKVRHALSGTNLDALGYQINVELSQCRMHRAGIAFAFDNYDDPRHADTLTHK